MTDNFKEEVYEIAFGDDAINRGFTEEEVIDKLREFSDKALELDSTCEHGHNGCIGNAKTEEKLVKDIEEHGWSCLCVDGESETGIPPFAYTVGLSVTTDFPELICIGLPPNVAHGIISSLVRYWKENGLKLGVLEGLLEGEYDLKINMVDTESDHDNISSFFPIHSFIYRESVGADPAKTEFVQVIFPNEEGEFEETDFQPFLPTTSHLREV